MPEYTGVVADELAADWLADDEAPPPPSADWLGGAAAEGAELPPPPPCGRPMSIRWPAGDETDELEKRRSVSLNKEV